MKTQPQLAEAQGAWYLHYYACPECQQRRPCAEGEFRWANVKRFGG